MPVRRRLFIGGRRGQEPGELLARACGPGGRAEKRESETGRKARHEVSELREGQSGERAADAEDEREWMHGGSEGEREFLSDDGS